MRLGLDAWRDEPAYKTCNTFRQRGLFIFDKLKQHNAARFAELLSDFYRNDVPDPQDIGKFEWQSILAYMGASDDASRLGRDMGQTLALQTKLVKVGVRLFHYQERAELKLDTPVHKMVASVANFSHEDFQFQISQKVTLKHTQKHRDGYVTNGKCYGYRNVKVGLRANGKPEYVVREPDPVQAKVLVSIFTRYAAGLEMHKLAAELNHAHVPSPSATWKVPKPRSHECLREMLVNQHCIGRIIYRGVTRVDETLRLIHAALWDAVRARLAEAKAVYLRKTGQLEPKPLNGQAPKFLLSGRLHVTVAPRCKRASATRGTGGAAPATPARASPTPR